MDWVTVLFIIFFFVLPVIQQLLEHARKGRQVPPEWERMEDDESALPTGWRRVEQAPAPSTDGGWSEGWGQWPESTDDRVDVEPETLERLEPEWVKSYEEVDAEEPGRLEVEWARPLPELPEIPVAAAPVRKTSPRKTLAIAAPMEVAVARPSPIYTDIRRALHDPAEVRKALILREILNPPLSLRDIDPELL